ncbi:Ig-like domain-containing protein [Mycolicibacterium sp. CBMA 226]|uniref:Ig-like domain-containing protein n=1 Tax=Mycolicibacterium sp. CBMA 226 TaxID=2606611 RepID=UPI0012DC0873|nr:Ig-like domain-containing protein [Mycolicibacterium sp. CBMA 226]MUL78765.1 hypothetical protein [Mycolicibacterium sp. CBMA 226]
MNPNPTPTAPTTPATPLGVAPLALLIGAANPQSSKPRSTAFAPPTATTATGTPTPVSATTPKPAVIAAAQAHPTTATAVTPTAVTRTAAATTSTPVPAVTAPTSTAATTGGAASLPGLITGVINNVLGLFGIGPNAGQNPLSLLGLAPLVDLTNAWFRQLQATFNNQTPTAHPSQSAESAAGVITGNVNGFDAEGDPLTYKVTQQPSHGTVTVDATGAYTYTPTIDEALAGGQDSFTVTITEANASSHIHGLAGLLGAIGAFFGVPGASDGSSIKTTVPVTITPINPTLNPKPVAGTPTVGTPDPTSGTVLGTLNFTQPAGLPMTYTVTTGANHGTATVNPDGSFSYTPTATAEHAASSTTATTADTTDTFTVTASTGYATAPETVTVSVLPKNSAPVAGTPTVGTPDPVTGAVTGTLGFIDAEGDPLSYSVTTAPTKGTVILDTTGGYKYTPTAASSSSSSGAGAGKTQFDTFTVTANDAHGGTTPETVTVPVLPAVVAADVPVVGPTPFTITNHSTTTGVVTGTVAVTDPQGKTLTYTAGTTPANGTVTVNATTGAWTYTPSTFALAQAYNAGGTGADAFTITATNPSNGSATVAVTTPVSVTAASLASMLQLTGSTPSAVAVGPTGTLYVTNAGANTRSIINPATNTITTTVPVGKNPQAVAVGANGQVWVANSGSNSVTVTGPTGTILDTVNVGDGASAIAFGTDGTAYVANANSNTVSVINANTYTISTTVPVGNTPTGIATGPDGRVYTANYAGGSVTIIDPTKNNATDTIAVPGSNPYGITVTNSGVIVVTDPIHNTVTELTAAPTSSAVSAAAVRSVSAVTATNASATNSAAATNPVTSSNGTAYTVNQVAVAGNPTAITSDTAGILYVTNTGTNTVTTINPTTGAQGTLVVGASPIAIAAGANGTINTLSTADNTLTVTNTQTGSATTTPVGVAPYTVTADPYGNLTVTNNYDNTQSVLNHPTAGSVTGSTGSVTTGTVTAGTVTAGTVTTGTATTVTGTATGFTVPAGTNPSQWVVVSPDGKYAFVTNQTDKTLTIVNAATGTATTVHTGAPGSQFGNAVTVSPDSGYAYSPNANDGTVSIINPATGTATTIHTGTHPGPVVVSPDSRYAYTTDPYDGTVSIINPTTGTATTIHTGTTPLNLTVSPDSRYAYVADGYDGTVSVINPTTGTATTFHNVYGQLVLSPDSRYAYVADSTNGTMSIINPTTGTATTFITDSPHNQDRVVVSPDSRYAYLTTPGKGTVVSVINPTTDTITAIPIANPGTSNYSVVASPDGRSAYVAGLGLRAVPVINPDAGTVTYIPIGTYDGALVVSPDGRYVYANNVQDDVVAVINSATGTSTTLHTGVVDRASLPIPVLVSPDSRYAFAAFDGGTVSVINPATGSFTNLPGGTVVVSPDSRYAYASGLNSVSVINPATGTATTIFTNTSPSPQDPVVVSPDGRYAYLSNGAAGTVTVINPSTGTATIVPMTNPNNDPQVALSPDGRYAFASDLIAGTVVVIDTTKLTFPAGTIAPDESTSTYVNTPVSLNPASSRYSGVTITGISTPAHGTAVLNGLTITYTPNTGYTGTDTFTYTATNPDHTGTGTIAINVTTPPSVLPDAPPGYTYVQGPTTVHDLFERLWATTNQNGGAPANYATATSMSDSGMHIEQVTNPNTGDVRYVAYFGGTGFTSYLSIGRNAKFFDPTQSGPYVDQNWLHEITTMVGNSNAPIMLVGFSQGGMDAQNIGSALYTSGYNVTDVITLASPVITNPSSAYTTLNFTPVGDTFGDAYSPLENPSDEYKRFVGFQGIACGGFPGHGCLPTYLTLADKFDHSTFYGSTPPESVYNTFKGDLHDFAGQILVDSGKRVSVPSGTPGGTLVPIYTTEPSPA